MISYKPFTVATDDGPLTAQAYDGRICFSLVFFSDEADADRYAKYSAAHNTFNGGLYHGMPCGRAKQFDHKDPDGRMLFAVTD